MSTTVLSKSNPSPAVTRRPPVANENTGNGSQRNADRRSLSVKLRDLFRKDSSTSNTNRGSSPAAGRQSSSSPGTGQPTTEAPHLHAPIVQWPFGKKKTNTSTTSKTKIKDRQKAKKTKVPPTNISSPIYEQENQPSIYGQNFVPRSPVLVHGNTERIQSSSSYEVTPTYGFPDYTINDQVQQSRQVVVPDVDVFTPPIYTSDRSRSPSMNRQRSPDYNYHQNYSTSPDYNYPQNYSTSPVSIPLADIEFIPTPQSKRKVDDTSSLTKTRIIAEKPPIVPQTSSNPTQWKSTSSSTLNNPGRKSSKSPSMRTDSPKLNTPSIPFGSTSSKKKPKQPKSKSRTDGKTSSTSTINNLMRQNPIEPNRSWTNTYGSLPDAEIIYGGSVTSLKPSKPITKKYPGLSAIVQYHQRSPASVYYNEYPSTTIPTTTTTSPRRPQRFETSTTTLNEYDQNQPWSQPTIYGSAPGNYFNQTHDGYIRPMTPQKPSIQATINITHFDHDDSRRQSPPPPSRYDSPESARTYRSSTTIYTRDKHNYIDGGEIRTWSSQENGVNDDYNKNSYRKPYDYVDVGHTHERPIDYSDYQVVPQKIKENYDEYRYSPRAHEQNRYEKPQQQKVTEDHDQQEEKYEVSFEYERQREHYSYEPQKHQEELHSTNQYNDLHVDKNLIHSNVTPTTHLTTITERDKTYDQLSRSNIDGERTQGYETRYTMDPVGNSGQIPHTYTLKRRASYDGLGILVSADSQTRLNHFIREVEPSSPGYRAGLRKNDRIISINGVYVENVDFSNVLLLIKQGLDNDNLQLTVIHEPEHI